MPGPGGMFPMPEWEENPTPWQWERGWEPPGMPKVGQPAAPAPTWGQGGIEDFIRQTVLDQNPDWASGLEEARGAPPWRVGQQQYADEAAYNQGEFNRAQTEWLQEAHERDVRDREAADQGLEWNPHSDPFSDEEIYSVPGPHTIPRNPQNPPGIPFGADPFNPGNTFPAG